MKQILVKINFMNGGLMENKNISDSVRDLVIQSIFSDDDLADILVLKGGNALKLLNLTTRESQDIDISIEENKRLDNEQKKIIESALRRTFSEEANLEIISFKFLDKPKVRGKGIPDFWGGYKVEFSLISQETLNNLTPKQQKNINAHAVNIHGDNKKIQVDFSFDEYTEGKQDFELNDYIIYIYSPLMLIYEKIRASCQQLPEYKLSKVKVRARDLYDIYSILTHHKQDKLRDEVYNVDNMPILKKIFAMKQVDLKLMTKICSFRDTLRNDYEKNVVAQLSSEEQEAIPFDYIYSFNEQLFNELYSLALK